MYHKPSPLWPYAMLVCLFTFPTLLIANSLKTPPKENTLETVEVAINGIYVTNSVIYTFPKQMEQIVRSPYNRKGKKRDEKFGRFADSKRINIGKKNKFYYWTSVIHQQEDRLTILDGLNLKHVTIELNEGKIFDTNTIPWDLINPPRDDRGAPTTRETKKLRSDFRKAFYKANRVKVTGATLYRNLSKTKKEYLVATQLPGFPIVKMECSFKEDTFCQFTRACNVIGLRNSHAKDLFGIAYDKAKNMIWMVDQKKKELLQLTSDNHCYKTRYVSSTSLPERIKKPSNVFIESESKTLWVTAHDKDDYYNASVFSWP